MLSKPQGTSCFPPDSLVFIYYFLYGGGASFVVVEEAEIFSSPSEREFRRMPRHRSPVLVFLAGSAGRTLPPLSEDENERLIYSPDAYTVCAGNQARKETDI